MEGLFVLIITFCFLIYGSQWIKKIDQFLEENNKATSYECVFLETSLLLSPLSFISSILPVQFDMKEMSKEDVYKAVQDGKIDVAIFTTSCTDLPKHPKLQCEKLLLPIGQFDLYNTIYMVYLPTQDLEVVKLLLDRCHR